MSAPASREEDPFQELRGLGLRELNDRRRELRMSTGLSPVGSEAHRLAEAHIHAIDQEVDRRNYSEARR